MYLNIGIYYQNIEKFDSALASLKASIAIRSKLPNKIKKTVWAHYIETGEKTAGLAHHAVLYFQDGKLNSGFANRYKDGKLVDSLLNYNPERNPNLRLEKTGVLKWTRWIDQLISQAKPSAL